MPSQLTTPCKMGVRMGNYLRKYILLIRRGLKRALYRESLFWRDSLYGELIYLEIVVNLKGGLN